jgi:ssDNA-binding Zn-finger/Zn-ribbon topoisomerase 1
VCPKYVNCPTCGRNQGKIHVCEGRWFLNCSKSVNMEHKCFILTQEQRDKSKKRTVDGEVKNQTRQGVMMVIGVKKILVHFSFINYSKMLINLFFDKIGA